MEPSIFDFIKEVGFPIDFIKEVGFPITVRVGILYSSQCVLY